MPRLVRSSEALGQPGTMCFPFVQGYHAWVCKCGTAQILPDQGMIRGLNYRSCLLLSHEFNVLHMAQKCAFYKVCAKTSYKLVAHVTLNPLFT